MNQLVIENEGSLLVNSKKLVEVFELDASSDELNFLNKNSYLDHIDLLELSSRLSYLEPSQLDRNLRLVDMAELMISDREKHFMISSLRMSVMKNFMDSRPNEFTIHKLFEKNYSKLINEKVSIVKRKNNPKHIPDFWLSDGHEHIPVEIKLHEFKKIHLKQLRRYMEFYKCKNGVAVARKLSCPLPGNITFINYEDLKEGI